MEKNLKNKILGILGTAIVITGTFAYTHLMVKNYIKGEVDDQKPYYQVIKDSENFDVDMSVADNYNKEMNVDKYVRLRMYEDCPVLIKCDETIGDKEKNIIRNVVEYYNNVFNSINENYKFKVMEKGDVFSEDSSVIFIGNKDLKSDVGGNTNPSIDKFGEDGDYFVEVAEIDINWDHIKDKSELFIYGIVLHEFSHVLGLGDVYCAGEKKISDVYDMTTFMNSDYTGKMAAILPNDYAILQVLYSNEYEKHKNYEDAVKAVNQEIDDYSEFFYEQYVKGLKTNDIVAKRLEKKDFQSGIVWLLYNEDSTRICELQFKDDNTCEFTISDIHDGLLDKCESEYCVVDGVLFVKGITIGNAKKYDDMFGADLGAKLVLCIYKSKGNLLVYDGISANPAMYKLQKNIK